MSDHPIADSPAAVPTPSSEHPLVLFTASGIHGTGGYARKRISAGTRVIEYVGEQIGKAEAARRCEAGNPFIFYLDETWDLDGDQAWNPARFLNHSCDPNCESELDGEGRIWISALRGIDAGEELTFNYGYDVADFKDHVCRCGAAKCVGYMVAEEHFDRVRGKAQHPS
jgi:SET domain-containing protein